MPVDIGGIAAFPRLSENDVFYWPEELEKFDGVTVPLRWNHNQTPDGIIGEASFKWSPEDRQVLYRATVVNEAAAQKVRAGGYQVSIGASVKEAGKICHTSGTCADSPILDRPKELSLVANAGIPENTLEIMEGKQILKLDCSCPQRITSVMENKNINVNNMETDTSKTVTEVECPDGKVDDGKGQCVDKPVASPTPEAKTEVECPDGKVDDGKGQCVDKPAAAESTPQTKDVTINVTTAPTPEVKTESVNVEQITKDVTEKVVNEFKETWKPRQLVTESKPDWQSKDEEWTAEKVANQLKEGRVTMTINKDDWLKTKTHNMVTEAVATSGTVPGVKLSTDIIVIPGSNTFEPLRSMGQFESIPKGENTAKFWTMDVTAFGAITESVSSDITASTHNLAAIDVTCSPRGILQQVLKSQMEDFPPKFLEKLKEVMRLAAIKDEHSLIVQTIASTANDFNDDTAALAAGFPAHIRGDTGAFVNNTTVEDAAGAFQKEGLTTARKLLAKRGHNPVQERLVAILSPDAYDGLINDSDISTFIQQGDPSISELGMLSKYFGIEILVSNELLVANNAYRNLVFVTGKAWALVSQREMEIEMDKEIAGQYVNIVATHRIGVEELDHTAYVIVSSLES